MNAKTARTPLRLWTQTELAEAVAEWRKARAADDAAAKAELAVWETGTDLGRAAEWEDGACDGPPHVTAT